jgi:hypothetical protein
VRVSEDKTERGFWSPAVTCSVEVAPPALVTFDEILGHPAVGGASTMEYPAASGSF